MADDLGRLVELAALALAPWPVLRLCVRASFWRTFPREATILGVALAVYAGVVLVLVRVAPATLPALAALAIAWLAALYVYERPGRGRRRGWPPGRVTVLSFGPWLERDFFLDRNRRHGSPFKTSQVLRPMVCIIGLAEGLELLRAHEASLSSPRLWFERFVPGGLLRHMEPAMHERYRDVFRVAFGREVFAAHESLMAARIRDELARMVRDSAASSGEGVRPRAHVQRMLFACWIRLFFGVEEGSPDFARLKALYRVIDVRRPRGASRRRIAAAVAEIEAVLRRLRATPAESPSVLRELGRRHPELADDPAAIGNLVYTMHVTWGDVSGLLQWIFRMLTDNPQWLERVRDAGAEAADPESLASRIVMETLRMEQSEHLYRMTTRPIRHGDTVIPRGWLVRVCVHESHRDPTVFEHPDTFDPDRFLRRAYARREFSPLGAGRHACLGEPLTRTIGRIFVEELARGVEWRTVADGPVEQGSWRHWRPSSRWRVVVSPRRTGPEWQDRPGSDHDGSP